MAVVGENQMAIDTPPSRAAVLLRPPDHQRPSRGPQLTHPGDPSLCPRLPNREHFKTAIYFHCGGLQLYPQPHGLPG